MVFGWERDNNFTVLERKPITKVGSDKLELKRVLKEGYMAKVGNGSLTKKASRDPELEPYRKNGRLAIVYDQNEGNSYVFFERKPRRESIVSNSQSVISGGGLTRKKTVECQEEISEVIGSIMSGNLIKTSDGNLSRKVCNKLTKLRDDGLLCSGYDQKTGNSYIWLKKEPEDVNTRKKGGFGGRIWEIIF